MNSLEAIVDQYTAKTAILTDFCNIVCNEEMKGEVGELEKEINEVKMLLAECVSILHHAFYALSNILSFSAED